MDEDEKEDPKVPYAPNPRRHIPPAIPGYPGVDLGDLEKAQAKDELTREYKEWQRKYDADVVVTDTRAKENIVEGSVTNWMHNDAFLFLEVDTGYQVQIGMKSLMKVIDKLVSEEVLHRLKGDEK